MMSERGEHSLTQYLSKLFVRGSYVDVDDNPAAGERKTTSRVPVASTSAA
jgi:hypothetical protein